MGERIVEVEKDFPQAGTRVVEESGLTGMISGHNAVGNPIMLPDDAVIGHELQPGDVVTLIPTPDDPTP